MSNTPNLSLPELANSPGNQLQANTTFAMLDALVQTPVISRTLTAAPVSPADGSLYIMASAWSGITGAATNNLALYRSASGWIVIPPKTGWKFEVAADGATYRYSGSAWVVWYSGTSSGASTGAVNVFTKNQSVAAVALTSGTSIAVDASLSNNFKLVLGHNGTLANPSNLTDGMVLNFRIKQDATGSRTLAYGSKFKFPGGTAPVLSTSANAVDLLSGYYDSTDDTICCSISKGFA